ncbi:MAG: polysaccharide deacetylase, partial [Hungatella sp.]
MKRNDYRRRMRRRRNQSVPIQISLLLLGIIAIGLIGSGIFVLGRQLKKHDSKVISTAISTAESKTPTTGSTMTQESSSAATTTDAAADLLLQEAARLAAGYDYDGAIALLRQDAAVASTQSVSDTITAYETAKSALLPYEISQITHIFFHSLIMDNHKAFDGDSREKGYNQVMTTKNEFLKILQSMYDRGYVLVRL